MRAGGRLRRRAASLRRFWPAATGLAVAGYAWWAVGLPPFSAAATVAVLSAGGAAAVAGRRWRVAARSAAAGAAWPWAALALAAAGWQLAAYLQHPRAAHPTVSSMANALLDSRPARAAAFLLWLAGAAHLGRR